MPGSRPARYCTLDTDPVHQLCLAAVADYRFVGEGQIEVLAELAPWRHARPVTAVESGWACRGIFSRVRIREVESEVQKIPAAGTGNRDKPAIILCWAIAMKL
ncbi:MAG: hypothetical protein C4575_14065 [Desulforudis sp.]|nr:MAG: hypothetical protein C4575_14065 [Desulforudis sp.]